MVGAYLIWVIGLPAAVRLFLWMLDLAPSPWCPVCGRETLPLQSSLCTGINRLSRRCRYQKHWCAGCGWEGTARLPRAAARSLATTPPPSLPCTVDRCGIRRLMVDGCCWRVMVHCWASGNEWVGRLMFIGPEERGWLEPEWSLRASSAYEVIARGLALPERVLADRIRTAAGSDG
ncbi:MAG: hypothetical protein ACLFRX_03600 [Gemmatimonadota bacterium]